MNKKGQDSFVAFFLVGVLSGFCLAIWLSELNLVPKYQPTESEWKGEWKCLEWEYGIKEDDWRTQRIGYCHLSDSNLDLICPLNKNYPNYFKCVERVWVERRAVNE